MKPAGSVRSLALVLLAGVILLNGTASGQSTTTPPLGLPDEGVLRLQLGAVDRFLWDHPVNPDLSQSIHDKRDLTGKSQDKCLLALGTETPLVSMAATGGVPGIAFDAIGVFGGGSGSSARGVDCSRVGAGESLSISLAGALAGRQVWRTELDIEVKQNARIRATASLGAQSTVFELRSGGSIVSGQGSSTPGSPIFNCNAASDSGNDSGPSDNCRWLFGGLWDSLKLETLAGEWSLEGGADFADALSNNSLFFLTRASGVLSCGEDTITVGDGSGSALATGTRLANADGSQCVLIPYLLESSGDLVSFQKDLATQTAAAFVFHITWTQESAVFPIPPTLHDFGVGGYGPFALGLCVGTPNYDPNGDLISLDGPLPDLVPTLPGIQYACILQETTTYTDTDTIQVRQDVYVEGDWVISRQ